MLYILDVVAMGNSSPSGALSVARAGQVRQPRDRGSYGEREKRAAARTTVCAEGIGDDTGGGAGGGGISGSAGAQRSSSLRPRRKFGLLFSKRQTNTEGSVQLFGQRDETHWGPEFREHSAIYGVERIFQI